MLQDVGLEGFVFVDMILDFSDLFHDGGLLSEDTFLIFIEVEVIKRVLWGNGILF